jgi:hypothetical protein
MVIPGGMESLSIRRIAGFLLAYEWKYFIAGNIILIRFSSISPN